MAKEKPALHECRVLIRYYDREEKNLLQPDRNEFRELACLNSTGRLFHVTAPLYLKEFLR